MGSIPRAKCDLNRDESLKTPFRTQIRQHYPTIKVLLDVHSFMPESVQYGGSDVALLTFDEPYGYETELIEYLKDCGINAILVLGQKQRASVIREAREAGVPAYLVEFNEKISAGKLKGIANTIAHFITTRYK